MRAALWTARFSIYNISQICYNIKDTYDFSLELYVIIASSADADDVVFEVDVLPL
jgi:hypothetical protein